MTVRAPHALAAALCGGIAAANVARAPGVGVAALAVGITAAAAGAGAERRVLFGAAALALAGWWWGSARLDALDRSVLLSRVGTAERTFAEVTAPARATRYSVRVPARALRFGRERVSESVLLLLPAGRAPPLGARLSFIATVELPRGPEHGFDERTWLRRHGVHVVLRADRWRVVGHRGGFRGFADRLHARIAAPLLRVRGERGALLVGVILGEDQGLAEELRTRFRASGLYHLLAVSGQNVAFVAGGALALVWLLGGTRLVGQLAALAAIGGYVFAVGPQPSVLRAGIVGALASLAWLAARQSDRWHFLLLAAVALLALNPYAVYDPGFQLSFAAVVAIFLFVPRLTRTLEGYPLPAKLSSAIAVSTACGVATAPILWLQFGAIPIVAVPANAVVEPVMPVLLGLGLLAALVDQVAHGPATLLAQLGGFCGAYVAACARFFGGLPFAQVQSTVGLLALAAVALVVAAWVWRRRADAYAWRRWLRR